MRLWRTSNPSLAALRNLPLGKFFAQAQVKGFSPPAPALRPTLVVSFKAGVLNLAIKHKQRVVWQVGDF